MEHFYEHVRRGDLATYSFIEPDHKPPLHPIDRLEAMGAPTGHGNSQHPENNLVDNDAYDGFTPREETDFVRGERLIASVYEALRANPDLFGRTVLVITYDEHGGLYDHLPASERVVPPGDRRNLLGRAVDALVKERAKRFDFTRLGVRVPTVVVSPLVPRGVVEHAVLEHASVPATLRAMFVPGAGPLTDRDAHARTFHHLWQGTETRTDLPDLSRYAAPPAARAATVPAPGAPATPPRTPQVPSYYSDFLAQTELVREHMLAVQEPEATRLDTTTSVHDGDAVAAAFDEAAHRHRHT
jgi:phospholipase C